MISNDQVQRLLSDEQWLQESFYIRFLNYNKNLHFLFSNIGQIPSSHFLTLFSKKHRYMLSSRYWGSSYKLGVRTEAYWSTRERLRIYQKKFCYNFLLRHCTKGICITAERYSVNVFPMQTIQWDWFMQSISAINTAKKCCIVVENSKKRNVL